MIFLSYVSEDQDRVMPYFELLEARGLEPWMDCKKIHGGQNWDYEIKTALDRSSLVLVFLSENSVDKRGYAQREIKLALDKSEDKLVGDTYIIPIKLDAVDYQYLLKGLHFLDATKPDFENKLLASIAAAQTATGAAVEALQDDSDVRWSIAETNSKYSGIPGYDATRSRISLASSKYDGVQEIADHINGEIAELFMISKGCALSPDPTLFDLMQNEWSRTNTFDAIFSKANVQGRAFSVRYSLNWYSAGAAHPVHSAKTFNYLLEPSFFLHSLRDIFEGEAALSIVVQTVRTALTARLYKDGPTQADLEWIAKGTASWDDFKNFFFDEEGISFEFESYQVACYAAGVPQVTVPYSHFTGFYKRSVLHALNLYR